MDSYEKLYRNFSRPEFAPIYYPTTEEFADPIAYVAKIRPEAEVYGVVKIVPPDNFKPPFAINRETFEFTPRVQRINEIEAIIRERLVFTDRLIHYWSLQGIEFSNPFLEGKYLDLFQIHHHVVTKGGFDHVCDKKLWGAIAKKIGLKANQSNTRLRDYYQKLVLPYVRTLKEVKVEEDESDEDEDVKDVKQECCEESMQGRRRARSGRMMAGLTKPRKQIKVTIKKKAADPMENVYCIVCQRGDDEERLLLCEDCDRSMHTTCCDPPLNDVPKGEWRCPHCVVNEISKIGANFGFYDAQTTYNINTFSEFANDFKKKFFNVKNPRTVASEAVEKEFWKHIIDSEHTVAVKYGADLITSKVGSGFPRKGDDHRGPDARQKAHYANHAWNLNNLPVLKESVLSHIETGISGMMVPWVYVGMCFSTFCWHTEDHWTYSINYNHWGERKIWYGIGGHEAEKFEQAVRDLAPGLTSCEKDIFHHMTTAVNPSLLRGKGVNVHTVHQNEGEFVITFPRAYHAGYNEGLNFAEAVNFAPIDWLKMGRICVSDYAMVKRFCVFSHDELVLKMVTSCDKLGIAMSLAALDELLMISKRESTGRNLVQKSGVRRTKKDNFHEIPDEQRVCRHCNTTLFLSALTCAHNKTVCLEHIDYLCKKCPTSECVLRYALKMEELEPMVRKLEDRTTLYFEWAEQVDTIFNESKRKPKLSDVEALIETARQKKFPNAVPLQRLVATVKQCNCALDRAKTLLNGKIRTRKETRIQRADTRLTLDGVYALREELEELPCVVDETIKNIDHLVKDILKWQEEAQTSIKDLLENDLEPDVIDNMAKLADRGEDFDVRLDEIDMLRKAVDTKEWHAKAQDILEWEPTPLMEQDDNFESRKRWKFDAVLKLMKDGVDLFKDAIPKDIIEDLHAKYKTAVKMDNMADRLLRGGKATIDEVENLWAEARNSDWASGVGLDWMRIEILQARELCQEPLSSEYSLLEVTRSVERTLKSTILSSTSAYEEMVNVKTKLEQFTKRLNVLFMKPNGYYSLVEILRGRDDLAALIEGQSAERELHNFSSPVEEWDLLCEFDTIADLHANLDLLRDQEKNLLQSLQLSNDRRLPKDTCVCASEKSDDSSGIVTCLLCRAKYHGSCCEWDAFLGQLPEGAYLCVRCLRGRRPCVEDVSAACGICPKNSMEGFLVRSLLDRTQSFARETMDLMPKVADLGEDWDDDLKKRVTWLVESVLSCEVLDLKVFPRIKQLVPKLYGDLMDRQKSICMEIRDRPVRADPLPVLFATVKKNKSKRSCNGREPSRKKKIRLTAVYHDDDQTCSADKCLKPYGDHVGWIQCEAGCSRWYHYVCVGQTVEGAKAIETYSCYRCEL